MTRLTAHFTLKELGQSQTATRHGINNTPNATAISNLTALAENILEPLRTSVGSPITVSSGYRSLTVNSLVGGAPGSQHTKEEAADINCSALGQQGLFDFIRNSNLPFDQLIDEFGTWVHVSYKMGV